MPTWMSANQISARYMVGEARLREYSQRGNLAMHRCADGTILYDVDAVAELFRSRAVGALRPNPQAKNMGIVGAVKLGGVEDLADSSPRPVTLSPRDERRRVLRFGGTNEVAPLPQAKTGTSR